ncbi:hypothetical protein [Streptomyces sp. NPDC004286]|uniref:hypothetical protein n=1 Tax=Streptomyces sp. NPDC004286 TaxID=3364696 RepID=UPI0036A3B404
MTSPVAQADELRLSDMKTRLGALALAVPVALTTLIGCSMTDDRSDDVPFAGTSTSSEAADAMEKVSSALYELIGVKGKASESRSGVMACAGKDAKTYFRVFHPWSFRPESASDLEVAMERLRTELPKHGWKVVSYGPDTSRNKNINLVADNDEKKAGVKIIKMAKSDPPMLSVDLVSGCYKAPDGQEVERF